jgi:hypothetical protein
LQSECEGNLGEQGINYNEKAAHIGGRGLFEIWDDFANLTAMPNNTEGPKE